MNTADTKSLLTILNREGWVSVNSPDSADAIIFNTCSVRSRAEKRVLDRIRESAAIQRKRADPPFIGVVGCMAHRLRDELLSLKHVDFIARPDSYRDIPTLLASLSRNVKAEACSVEGETYSDILPLESDIKSLLPVMRGCDRHCTYCVVPSVRGPQRSVDLSSLILQAQRMVDQGAREITLLGQNVNMWASNGSTFDTLLTRVSAINPATRIRFTSAHPLHFPPPVLSVIRQTPNVCSHIHIPAQSGSSAVLRRMGRGYSRSDYDEVVSRCRDQIPNVCIGSDFICGFPGETEADHLQTLDLVRQVDSAFLFAFDPRPHTRAARMPDQVDESTKQRRLSEAIECYHKAAAARNQKQIGTEHVLLVDGASRRGDNEFAGKTQGNTTVNFPSESCEGLQVGDYCKVKIIRTTSFSWRGEFVNTADAD